MTSAFEYFDPIWQRGHQAVLWLSDPSVGLRGFIGLHNTTLGPALGGCRMKAYASERDALDDVLRLSRAMSYKSSVAGLNLGGGKTVVILEKPEDKTPALLQSLAERINLLKGTYIGAGDVGSTTDDLRIMKQTSPWVVGLAEKDGGLGDSAILTSLGVFRGIQAAVKEKLGQEDLDGIRVAIQGSGKVGALLVDHLIKAGCSVWVADVNTQAVKAIQDSHPQVTICENDALYDVQVDVFSPNAIGGLITDAVAKRLQTKILAGGANNPLAGAHTANILNERGILYAPDFVINAGGIIMVDCERLGLTFEEAQQKTMAIYDTTLKVFEVAKQRGLLPWDAAQKLAIERIEAAAKQTTPPLQAV